VSKTGFSAEPPHTSARLATAANDNRRVVVRLRPPKSVTAVEIEVFGVLLAECPTANDNLPDGTNLRGSV
jgi:hypothetical protein